MTLWLVLGGAGMVCAGAIVLLLGALWMEDFLRNYRRVRGQE